ncbi:hypothetical protein LLE49_20370 [Alicyclobacillus tolerans]|nr:hypothetical protein [Alicyclobacillus tolerans]MCF8567078.1 hypothetical protein [Alicyclobacillus tolerans]
MAVNREELHRLIDQITDPIELEIAYRAIGSIIKHDEQSLLDARLADGGS